MTDKQMADRLFDPMGQIIKIKKMYKDYSFLPVAQLVQLVRSGVNCQVFPIAAAQMSAFSPMKQNGISLVLKPSKEKKKTHQ